MTKWRRVVCCISKATRAQAHASDRARTFTPTYARTHTQVLENTRIEICNTLLFNDNVFVNAPQYSLAKFHSTLSVKF